MRWTNAPWVLATVLACSTSDAKPCNVDGSSASPDACEPDAARTASDAFDRDPLAADAGLDASVDGSTSPKTPNGPDASDVADASTATDASDAFEPPEVEGPALQALSVEGIQGQPWPAFDPAIHRYAMLARDPTQDLEITAVGDEGTDVTVAATATDGDDRVVLQDVEPGSEIEIVVDGSEGQNVYVLVYLPSNFPELRVTTHRSGASSDPIYLSLRGVGVDYVTKLDQYAVPLFHRALPRPGFDFKKHPTGEMSYAVSQPGGSTSEQVVLDERFEEVERVLSEGLSNTDQHEFKILPNGNYIVLAHEHATRDVTPFGGTANQAVIDGVFQEMTRERDVLFEWNSWDHMRYDESVYTNQNALDYAHLNSVDIDEDGNWLLSSRGLSQLLKVDRSTGDVIWRLGGVASDFTFVDDPYANLCGQHTADWLDNGNILLFDNGQYCWPRVPERGQLTRIVEYAIDETAMTATLIWSYVREGVYSTSQGSSQRLANGNTFIGWGAGTALLATEVQPSGRVVFELEAFSPAGAIISYRAYRFADGPGRMARPGTPPDVGSVSSDGGVGGGANPVLEQLCGPSCASQASAGCGGFDEDDCLRDCISLGLYLVYYLDCLTEFEAARECEASIDYACPGPDDQDQCASERDAQSACMLGGL